MEANSNLFIRNINSYTGNPTDSPSVRYLSALSNSPQLISLFNAGGTGFDQEVDSLAIQADGKIICGGRFTTYNGLAVSNKIVRLFPDGSVDPSFNTGGTGFDQEVDSLAIQPDGKIICGGQFTTYNGSAVSGSLVRLNLDGTIDPSFNPGGAGFSSPTVIWSLQIQPDGKIIAGGGFSLYNGAAVSEGITRINPDGSLDASFNAGGAGLTGGGGASVFSLQLQPDGKIIAGGTFTDYNGLSISQNIQRFNADGSLDATFNVAGSGFDNDVYALALQADGKIIVGGAFGNYNGSAIPAFFYRLNPDGSPDAGFNPGGAGYDTIVYCISIQANKIIVGGYHNFSYNGVEFSNELSRINDDGSLDTGFNPGTVHNGNDYFALMLTGANIFVGGSFSAYNGSSVSENLIKISYNGNQNDGLQPLNFYGYNIINPNASDDVFVKLYDTPDVPVVGTDIPVWVIQVPKGGSVVLIGAEVIRNFENGLWLAAVTGYQDSDNTAPANDLLAFVHYKIT